MLIALLIVNLFWVILWILRECYYNNSSLENDNKLNFNINFNKTKWYPAEKDPNLQENFHILVEYDQVSSGNNLKYSVYSTEFLRNNGLTLEKLGVSRWLYIDKL